MITLDVGDRSTWPKPGRLYVVLRGGVPFLAAASLHEANDGTKVYWDYMQLDTVYGVPMPASTQASPGDRYMLINGESK